MKNMCFTMIETLSERLKLINGQINRGTDFLHNIF